MMSYDVYIVYEDPSCIDRVLNAVSDKTPYIHFLDIGSKKDQHKAYQLKGSFGARLNPFVGIKCKDKPIKGFYSETGDAISQLLIWLNDAEN